jgi:hypothetical protein
MGGVGSSRWSPGYQRREIVQNCKSIRIKDFYLAGVLKPGDRWVAPDHLAQMRHDRGGLWIRVRGADVDNPKIWIKSRTAEGAIVKQQVGMEIVLSRAGMPRLWFRCPLGNHSTCPGRVRNLYLPPDGSLLGCRKCHGLSYASVLKYDESRCSRSASNQGKSQNRPVTSNPTDPASAD